MKVFSTYLVRISPQTLFLDDSKVLVEEGADLF